MKKVDINKLRHVRLEWTTSGARFVTTDLEPLVEGERVRFGPEDTDVGIVGKVIYIGEPYEALGLGETYAEQVANARMVRYQVAEVGQAQVKVSDLMARAIAANCR